MNGVYRRLLAAGVVMLVAGTVPAPARADDPVPEAGVALPAGPGTPGRLAVSQGGIFAAWADGGTSTVLATSLGDNNQYDAGGWSPAVPGATVTGTDFEASFREVLTPLPARPGDDAALYRSLVTYSGGSREVTSTGAPAHLAHGGRYLVRRVTGTDGAVVTRVEVAAGGGTAYTVPGAPPVSVWYEAELSIWSASGSHLTGDRYAGTTTTRTEHDLPCAPDSIDVNGRWVLSHCADGWHVDDTYKDIVPSWPLPLDAADGTPVLGRGFVAWPHQVAGGPRVVVVADLNDFAHGRRTYGPITASGGPAAHDTSAVILAYADPAGTARLVTLSWLKLAPTAKPDITAPVLLQAGVAPPVTRSSMRFAWGFIDPTVTGRTTSGVDYYRVQLQQKPDGATSFQPWQELTGIGAQTAVDFTNGEDTDTCFRVLAHDRAGNVSDWSPAACSVTDLTAPGLTATATSGRVASGTSLAFAYAFTDRHGVASYDLEYREAPLGVGAGAWSHPASWYGATATAVVRTAPAGSDTCFHVRARDRAGNVSPWSDPRCEAAPLDDKALAATGTVRRVATTAVPSGQVSTLAADGAALTYSALRTNRLGLRAKVGPSEGAVDVYVGATRLGRASFAASAAGWATVWLPATAMIGGQLKLVRVAGTRNATIDGVAVLQQ